MGRSCVFLLICGIAVKWSRERGKNALYVEGGYIIDSHSSRKRRARVRIKARRDREAERGPIAIQSFSFFFFSFISFRDAPLCRASMLLRRRAAALSTSRDSPPNVEERTTFSAPSRNSPPAARPTFSSHARVSRRRSRDRDHAHCRRALHADARAFLRIALRDALRCVRII